MALRDTLLFFTAGFPYGNGETFIENEISFLADSFDKVIIFIPQISASGPLRALPENVEVRVINNTPAIWLRIQSLFSLLFWRAFFADLQRKNLSVSVFQAFRVAWGVYAKAMNRYASVSPLFSKGEIKAPDSVFYSYWFDESAVAGALLHIQYPDLKVISRAHRWDVYENMHPIPYLPFRPFMGKHLANIVCIAADCIDYLKRLFSEIKPDKLVLSYLGTEPVNPFSYSVEQPFHLVSCSTVIPRKRVHLIAESLVHLTSPVIWTHLGDGPELQKIQEKYNKEFYGDKSVRIHFKGQMKNSDVRKYYSENRIDLFISLSASEGLPVSMMEAQSAGIPILSNDVGGISEIVKDNVTGWLLRENITTLEVAEKLKEILEIPAGDKLKMRQTCIHHWQAHFSAECNYPLFVKILKGE